MYSCFTKASPNPCTLKQKFMTLMQLWHLLEDLLGCFLDSRVINVARD